MITITVTDVSVTWHIDIICFPTENQCKYIDQRQNYCSPMLLFETMRQPVAEKGERKGKLNRDRHQ